MTIEEKIKLIDESHSFAEIPLEAMPTSHKENYYFVSYSHKDYKEVLKDILLLENLGINIWYDNEMHIGENWREIAQMYISKFQCSGVIFYLTENSISSPACNQEVEYVLMHNKGFFSINKALDGCQTQSGYSMLLELVRRGLVCDNSLLENFKKAFSDEMLYLGMDESIANKAHKINAIKREELLRLEATSDFFYKKRISISACRDNTIITIDLSKKHQFEDLNENISAIDDCVFTNSIKLQSVKISPSLVKIGESAFRNCILLENIDLSKTSNLEIEKSAFQNCTALKTIDISKVRKIGESAFRGCTALEITEFSGEIQRYAFYGAPIKKIKYIEKCPRLLESAFCGCSQLEEINIINKFISDLGEDVFYGCKAMRNAGPFIAPWTMNQGKKTTLSVGRGCFNDCNKLESIKFEGAWNFDSAIGVFWNCKALKKMELNIAGTIIPDYFARGCESLEKITNTSRFSKIGEKAFFGCINLRSFELENVKSISKSAFENSGIELAYLKSVETISNAAFANSKHLKTVYIGKNCKKIEDSAFSHCISLTTLKILTENVEISKMGNVFSNTDIKVAFLRSSVILDVLMQEGVISKLRYLYIDENIDISSIDLSYFEHVESDELGFMKFVQEAITMPIDDGSDIDITAAEINEPISNGERFPMDMSGMLLNANSGNHLIGNEFQIKHARLHSPHTYFIEEAISDGNGKIQYLIVSTHTGKSFRLDGTLIKSMNREFEKKRSTIRLDSENELDGTTCCIVSNGKFIYCTITDVHLLSNMSMYKLLQRPIRDENSKYILEAVFYSDEGRRKAVSALDIDKITIFDNKFEAIKTIKAT